MLSFAAQLGADAYVNRARDPHHIARSAAVEIYPFSKSYTAHPLGTRRALLDTGQADMKILYLVTFFSIPTAIQQAGSHPLV